MPIVTSLWPYVNYCLRITNATFPRKTGGGLIAKFLPKNTLLPASLSVKLGCSLSGYSLVERHKFIPEDVCNKITRFNSGVVCKTKNQTCQLNDIGRNPSNISVAHYDSKDQLAIHDQLKDVLLRFSRIGM